MRVTVAIEGAPYPDGRLILPGAIQIEKDPVPVMWLGDQSEVIGKASAIEREDVGDKHIVSMEVELTEKYQDMINLKDVEAFVYASINSSSENHTVIHDCEMKGVSISLNGGYPKDLRN